MLPSWVGLKECFGHVAIPKMIAPPVRVRISKKVKCAELAFITKIKCLIRPEHANVGSKSGVWILSLPVRTKRNYAGFLPFLRRVGGIQFNVVRNMGSDDLVRGGNALRGLGGLTHHKERIGQHSDCDGEVR